MHALWGSRRGGAPFPNLHKDTRLVVDLGVTLDIGIEMADVWAGGGQLLTCNSCFILK